MNLADYLVILAVPTLRHHRCSARIPARSGGARLRLILAVVSRLDVCRQAGAPSRWPAEEPSPWPPGRREPSSSSCVLLVGHGHCGAAVLCFVRLSLFSGTDRFLGFLFGLLREDCHAGCRSSFWASSCGSMAKKWWQGSKLMPYGESVASGLRAIVGDAARAPQARGGGFPHVRNSRRSLEPRRSINDSTTRSPCCSIAARIAAGIATSVRRRAVRPQGQRPRPGCLLPGSHARAAGQRWASATCATPPPGAMASAKPSRST